MTVEFKREGWLPVFTQMREPTAFLTRLFTVKPGGIYNGAKVSIDIERSGEDVATVITVATGPNMNDISQFTTKEFTPPAYGEAFPLDVLELLDRMAGVDPYTAAYTEYATQMVGRMAKGFMQIDSKIQRAVELQASQVLQTGTLTLKNREGDTAYTLNFQPKATHFPTAGTAWNAGGADPLADLKALAEVIRADGKVDPDRLIMGENALFNFLRDDNVKAVLDNQRYEIGQIAPEMRDSGATFYGYVWVGTYRLEIWAYNGTYKDPATGNPTKYIDPANVVMLSRRTRLDMTSARVPLPLGPDPRVANLLPGRVSSAAGGFDVTPNVYCTPNGKQIMGELESRPLLVPVQIDGFGCLDTGS